MTEIICILATGKSRAARESVAKVLKGELDKADKRVLITHFADPLKDICRKWFDWDGRMDDAGRSLLQYIGTDIVRARLPDFWIDFTMNLLSMMGDEWDYVIIPDCRWPNEVNLDRYGFQPRHILLESKYSSAGIHTPEKLFGITTPDFTIVSDDTIDRLRSDVAVVAHQLLYD